MKLELSDHFVWLALRRVNGGGVVRSGEVCLDGGARLGGYLADLVGQLVEDGLLSVAEPSAEDGLTRISLTEAGAARYRELCRQQRKTPPRPVEFLQTTTGRWQVHRDDEPDDPPETPAGRRLSAPRSTAPGGRPDPS